MGKTKATNFLRLIAFGLGISLLRMKDETDLFREYEIHLKYAKILKGRLGCVSKVESMTAERKKLAKPKGN